MSEYVKLNAGMNGLRLDGFDLLPEELGGVAESADDTQTSGTAYRTTC